MSWISVFCNKCGFVETFEISQTDTQSEREVAELRCKQPCFQCRSNDRTWV